MKCDGLETSMKEYKDKNYYFYHQPKLVNRSRCYTYDPGGGCLFCGNKTFRYYSTAYGKKYFQCEKYSGINH
ncbi:hypothetical protein AUJ66_03650 [Candidatus Desantisbacteria bacterium CG1_02_38_46]|uniref:Uncharacterized protein n=3 Tax=unclassified Candidatus Desantisiibacteriota TaxID=3106372 RepID=A0A2H9PBN6_9BACT|nr:MAG: hypothetical protein AUJ66_03650 [Candidatus Desantisbacteria bacterium CG1_02_38_46]PIU51398.1 MAG: hypothetical protein COS91_04640 [Candidatus Desantisbacteria bacterium CG07_land_8_20_14_0_80_39_15]PIZ16297.1 MAG: hypothetical protein COY51_03065 [Candidatus Desantisbacteria bacterium CG_4_10_14_0_8_um_filter_39_17]